MSTVMNTKMASQHDFFLIDLLKYIYIGFVRDLAEQSWSSKAVFMNACSGGTEIVMFIYVVL